jgi:hypothetical protein
LQREHGQDPSCALVRAEFLRRTGGGEHEDLTALLGVVSDGASVDRLLDLVRKCEPTATRAGGELARAAMGA